MTLSSGTFAPTDVRLLVRDLRNQARDLGDVLAVLPDEPDDDQRATLAEWANAYVAKAQSALDDLRDVVADMTE